MALYYYFFYDGITQRCSFILLLQSVYIATFYNHMVMNKMSCFFHLSISSMLSISSLCFPSPLYAFHLLSAFHLLTGVTSSSLYELMGPGFKSMGPGFENRWDPASIDGPSMHHINFPRYMTSSESRGCVLISSISRSKKNGR